MDESGCSSSGGFAAALGVVSDPVGGVSDPVGGVGEERRPLPPTLIVIPAFNEAATIGRVVAGALAHGPVIVVDDGSTDATAELAQAAGAEAIRHARRLGKGQAIRTGLAAASIRGAGSVVTLDGDGQHDPADIVRLLAPIRDGRADAVQGARHLADPGRARPTLRMLGQRGLAVLLSRLTRRTVTDPTSGFWAFGPRAVAILGDHHPTGYPEPELLLFLHRNGLRTVEIPVRIRRRLAGRTSLDAPRAGLALARVLLALVVVPLRDAVEAPGRD